MLATAKVTLATEAIPVVANENYGFYGTPFTYLSWQQITKYNNTIITHNEKGVIDYKNTNNPKWQLKGETTETIMMNGLNCLAVEASTLAATQSVLDMCLRIDIAAKVGEKAIGLQIKSSEEGAIMFWKKWQGKDKQVTTVNYHPSSERHTVKGATWYPAPGIIWISPELNRIQFITDLSTWLGVPFSDKVINALKVLELIKKLNAKAKKVSITDKVLLQLITPPKTRKPDMEVIWMLNFLKTISIKGEYLCW